MPTPHTVQQLDHLIISHWEHVHDVDAKLKELLSARKSKINSVFEWTPENIDALLRLNQRLTNCFEKVRDEAKPESVSEYNVLKLITSVFSFQKKIE